MNLQKFPLFLVGQRFISYNTWMFGSPEPKAREVFYGHTLFPRRNDKTAKIHERN